jgi:putative colanic acid biosynthesis acetyltransferase WcaF
VNEETSQPSLSNEDFRNPHGLANKVGRLLWSIVYVSLYRWTPARLGMFWRRWILQAFGAKIGRSWLHPSTRIWAPWLLKIGDYSYIDHHCYLYNAYPIEIGDRVIISFGSVLCTPTHDYNDPTYPLIGERILIESDSWLMAEAFICPGVRIRKGGVVAARAVVTKDVESMSIVGGNPAKFIKARNLS